MSHLMPRRTSEFRDNVLEDNSVADRRQQRSTMRGGVTPTPKSTKTSNLRPSQSRISQPLCLERDRASQMIGTPNHNHRRPMFSSVERPVALHSDKKWVAERSQQIFEYLRDVSSNPTHSLDISRINSLRQMTIKEFVGIINHFFHQIFGNRVTVGQNHVEDIIGAMQRLNYPHQMGKSWLMSPTTQHSFGHVIVLLDFLIDFAPSSEEPANEFLFTDTSEQPSSYQHSVASESMAVMSTTQSHQALQLDEELNALLFAACRQCNVLWDQEHIEEEDKLKAKTSELVLSKKYDLENLQALNQEIDGLRVKNQRLEEQLSSDNEKIHQLKQLTQEQNRLAKTLAATQKELSHQMEHNAKVSAKANEKQVDLERQVEYERRLQHKVKNQKYNVQQLQDLQTHSNDLLSHSKVYERQVKNVSDMELNQQVMLARAKQKQLDSVEAYNSDVHKLTMDSVICQLKRDGGQQLNLALPLQPTLADIGEHVQCLEVLGKLLQHQRRLNDERRQQLEQQKEALAGEEIKLYALVGTLNSELAALKQHRSNLEASHKAKLDAMLQHQQQLLETDFELRVQLEEQQKMCETLLQKLTDLETRNEEIMSSAERYQEEDLQARNTRCDEIEKKLEEAEEELEAFTATLATNKAKLELAKEELDSFPMPSFEPVMEAINKLCF
ncbi:kinetochore protein NDC80 homolog [Drosophila serrata]|uniref:kinetochore protein NDC80 homolog n=1 Tax=Drosophila serrata TaxID=7274 RepID=UPI000A1D1A54|nr:kinetochore protein NDC80 homolog [Drosophila serrata]